jgi:hypothetical protein
VCVELHPHVPGPPSLPQVEDVLYRGEHVRMDQAAWERLGWSAEQAREYLRDFPRDTRPEVVVLAPDGVGPLEHYPYHSRGGFDWGLCRPGLADLARAILLHHYNIVPAACGQLYPPRRMSCPSATTGSRRTKSPGYPPTSGGR